MPGALAVEVDHAGLDRGLGAVDVLDEVDQTTRVVEHPVFDLLRCGTLGRLLLGGLRRFGVITHDLVDDLVVGDPFIGQLDRQALVEEGHLLQTAGDGLEVVDRGFEDIRIRPEADRRAGLPLVFTLFRVPGTELS